MNEANEVDQMIDLITSKLIRTLRLMSHSIIIQGNLGQREEWLKTLSGFADELEPYTEILSVENSLKNIASQLNGLSEEERRIFITDEQMALINEHF